MIGRRAFTRGIPLLAAALALVALGGCHVHGHANKPGRHFGVAPPGKHWHGHHGPPRHHYPGRRHRHW